MKYKVGDRVKMKKSDCDFGHDAFFSKHNYVLTIKGYVNDSYYLMEEDSFCYLESSIDSLYVEEIFEPINDRSEILDLRR